MTGGTRTPSLLDAFLDFGLMIAGLGWMIFSMVKMIEGAPASEWASLMSLGILFHLFARTR